MVDRAAIIESDYISVKRCRRGLMAYNVNDTFVGRHFHMYGEFNERQGDMFRQLVRPGGIVIDVGANIGGHAVPLAQQVGPTGQVYAFEPQRITFGILCTNITLNALTNVWPIWAAAGHPQGTKSIIVPFMDPTQEANFGGLTLRSGREGDSVPIISLDTLPLPACTFIKIDVEGMEAEVLRGATGIISRFRPPLYVENEHEEQSRDLIALLFELDYRLYWHLTALFNPENFFGETKNVFSGFFSINMLCLPKEWTTSVNGLVEITSPEANWHLALG